MALPDVNCLGAQHIRPMFEARTLPVRLAAPEAGGTRKHIQVFGRCRVGGHRTTTLIDTKEDAEMGLDHPLGGDSTAYGFPTFHAGTAQTARTHLSVVPNDFDALFDEVEDTWQDRALCARPTQRPSSREGWLDPRGQAHLLGLRIQAACLEYAIAQR